MVLKTVPYCLPSKHFIIGKCVLELGSGLGLFGLHLLKREDLQMESYTFSDGHLKVVDFLKINVAINFAQVRSYIIYRTVRTCVQMYV